MKITQIKFKNHQVLGDFAFDFQSNKKVKDFSLLVGENGCGKTIFLEEIFKIISGGITLWNDKVDREISFTLSDGEKETLGVDVNLIIISYTDAGENNWLKIKVLNQDREEITSTVRPKIQNNSFNNLLKGAYSTVEINFASKEVDAVRATDVDTDKMPKSKSNPDLASEISQLLVDIKVQDDSNWGSWGRKNVGKDVNVPKLEGKFERFQKAYARMFDGKILYDTRPDGGKHKILFKDTLRDVEFDISRLSSGEKQVVYRAGYLLRNFKNLDGGIILIDEPELSLHPKWQIKYLDFLRELFKDEKGLINIQFLIATHSPFILKDISRDDTEVFVFHKDQNNGKINVQNTNEYNFGILKRESTWGEICYFAYNLSTTEFHDDLYSSIEEKLKIKPSDRISQDDVEDWLIKNGQTKEIKWKGSTGNSVEETLMTYVRNRIHHPDNSNRSEYTLEQLSDSINRMIALLR